MSEHNPNLINKIDDYQSNQSVTMPYPHVFVTNSDEALPLVLDALEEGELAVVFSFKGNSLKARKSIKNTAMSLYTLSKIYKLEYYTDANTKIQITDNMSILESDLWSEVV